jgi:hypothetical protein
VTARRRAAIVAAAVALALFAGWSAWRLSAGMVWLDVNATRVSGFLLRGAFDVFVSSLWPFGEPQFGVLVAAVLAGCLGLRGRWRAAGLLIGGYTVLTLTELGMRAAVGLVGGSLTLRHALVHAYPSGHAARIPFLGVMLALVAPRQLRLAVLVATGVLTLLEGLDRVDSTLQTASDVIGGTLLGTWLALTVVALLPLVERASLIRRHDRP